MVELREQSRAEQSQPSIQPSPPSTATAATALQLFIIVGMIAKKWEWRWE
jgi:hypothetical protein